MQKFNLLIAFSLFWLLISSVSASSNLTNTNNLSIGSVASSNSIQSLTSNTLNQTIVASTFKTIVSPFVNYTNYLVLLIFVLVLAYGLIEIFSELNIEPEKKLKAMIEYTIGASSILLVVMILYAYFSFFPEIIKATASNLLAVHSKIPFEIIWFNLFVAVIISIVGFLFAMKELLQFVRTFQPTLASNEEAKEFNRNASLTRFFVLIAFAFFSPLIVGMLFVILTQVFLSFSTGVSNALSSVAYNSANFNLNSVSAQMYYTNTNFNCGANIFSQGFWTCLGANLLYLISANSYSVGFEAVILNTGIKLMLSPFGANLTFWFIYEIVIMLLYIYAFAKIDYYSLQYVSSLKTGEKEAFNYEKLKRAYLQYIGFVLSPILFIIALILLNSFIAMFVSSMSSYNMLLIPPLLNINSPFTADNLLLDIAGAVMIIFAVIFILAVIFTILFRLLGGIIFAIGIFFYLSEDYKYRMFGRNLLIAFAVVYLAPLILVLIYSFWFGYLPMSISQVFGSAGLSAVSYTSGGYSSSVINTTSVNINSYNIQVSCNSGTSIANALAKIGYNTQAVSVLIGSCQNFVGYWANGYIIMAFVSLVLLILLIFGFGAVTSAIAGITGLGGGEGSIAITSGLSGLSTKEKISQVLANMKENRSRYAQKLKAQGGIMKTVGGAFKGGITSTFGKAVKVGSMTENVAYGLVTAPIAGTQLGNALDFTRQATKNVIAKTFERPDTYAYGNADDVVNAYLEKTGGKKEGETDDQAKERAKQELAEQYGIEFNNKTNTFKAKKKAIEQLKAFTGKDIKASYSNFNSVVEYDEAKQELEDAKKEQSEALKEYEDVEKAYKEKKATKEQLKEAEDKLNRATNRVIGASEFLDRAKDKLKDYGFESVEEYENKKSINDAFLEYDEAKRSGDKEKIKETYNNLESKLKSLAMQNYEKELDKQNLKEDEKKKKMEEYEKMYDKRYGKKLKQMLEDDNTYADFQNILGTAYTLKGTEDFIDFISQAVEGKREITLKRVKSDIWNSLPFKLGRASWGEFITPNWHQLKERYYSVKDILGKMKDYNIISGVDLIDVYNKEMLDISNTIDKLKNKYLEAEEKLTNAKTKEEIEQYKQELSKITDQMQSLKDRKDILDRSKKLVEAPALLTLSILNKKTIEELKKMEAQGKLSELPVSLSNLSRLAHGDDLGRITLTKAMLENEARIKARTREILEKELQKATEEMKTATTESQKMQLANTIKELQNKLRTTSSEYQTITANKNAIEEMVNELNAIRKPIITNSKYTFEKEFKNAINDFVVSSSNAYEINKQREQIANEITELQNKAKTIKSRNFKDIDEKTIRSIFDTLSKDIAKSKSPALKKIYKAYKEEDFATLRDLLEEHKRTRSTLVKTFNEYANKIIAEKQKKEEELYNQQLNEVKTDFAKLLYNTQLNNSINQQAVKFDFENMKAYISKYLETNKNKLGINDNEVNILKSFDSSLFNLKDEGEKRKLITIVNEKIIPVIEEMSHNKFTKILKEEIEEMQRKVENMEYKPVMSKEEIEKLDDLQAREEATRVVYNFDNLYKQITGKKPEKIGNAMKKGAFKGKPVHYGQVDFSQGRIKVENLNQNNQNIIKDDGNEQGTME